MTDKITAKVYATKNYDKFQPFKGNRGASPTHIRNLSASMKSHGWIGSMPMTCYKNGTGKLHILDGHNRFYAAKSIGCEVKYAMVDERLSEQEIYAINRNQRRWSSADFIKSYARMGYEHYKIAQEFMEKHHVGVPTACALLANKPGVSMKTIEDGTFQVADLERANYLAGLLSQAKAALRLNVRMNMLRVFIKACSFDDIDPSRLIEQMIKYPNLVMEFTREEDIADMLENVYNFHKGEKNKVPLAFMVRHRYKAD